jgi:hypothetical protein
MTSDRQSRWIKFTDRLLSAGVITLGVMQCLSTPYFFRRIEEPAAWFFAGGMLLMLVGALGLLRLKYGVTAPGVRHVALGANLLLAIFYIALYWALYHKFAQHPASFTGLFVILASNVVSLLNTPRARTREGDGPSLSSRRL